MKNKKHFCTQCRYCFVNLSIGEINREVQRNGEIDSKYFLCLKNPKGGKRNPVTGNIRARYYTCDSKNKNHSCVEFKEIPKNKHVRREYQGKLEDPSTWFWWKKIETFTPQWKYFERNLNSRSIMNI